jgi:hypothetical protein
VNRNENGTRKVYRIILVVESETQRREDECDEENVDDCG